MPITKSQIESFVTEHLGGSPEGLTVAQIINTAGISMVNMRRWYYLKRTESDLDIVADQPYVDLPADLQTLTAVSSSVRGERITYVSPGKMIEFRKGEYGTPTGFVATVVGATVSSVEQYRLDLYPTPSVSVTGGVTVSYKAGWPPVDSLLSGENIRIPAFLEPLFFEIVLAVAKGFEKHDMGNLSSRLAEVAGGYVFATALKTDIALQPILGSIPVSGGGSTSQQVTLLDPEEA